MQRILRTIKRIASIAMLITAVSCSGPGSPTGIPTSTQLGTPTPIPSTTPTPTTKPTVPPTLFPTQAPALKPYISAGTYHTCVQAAAGRVQCWGWNKYGQLGDGTKIDRLTPVDVLGLAGGVSAISAGSSHTCALTSNGGVKCWGQNNSGQLGDGTTTDSSTPVDVVGLTSGVSAIAAGDAQTCALTVGGGVKCWGSRGYGLGDGTLTDRHTPVDVIGLASGVSTITTGGGTSCALTVGGGVKCWGSNWKGQLGDGTTTARLTPVDVSGLASGVTAIATHNYSTCALTAGGGVKCWGFNEFGQLGDGTTTDSSVPVDVSGLASGVSAISVAGLANCVLTFSSGVKCWGSNARGGLGDGTTTDRHTPVDVSGLTSGVSAIAAGGAHVCAITSSGEVKCWGYNNHGQLGDGTYNYRTVAVDVKTAPLPTQTAIPATPQLTLKLMTYNIWLGAGVDPSTSNIRGNNMNRLADLITLVKQADPDILGLQELYFWDTGDPPIIEQFASALNMNYYLAPTPDGSDNAIFSKYPILEGENLWNSIGDSGLRAVVQTPDGRKVRVIVVHLVGGLDKSLTRSCQFDKMRRMMESNRDQPGILMGDINSLPSAPEVGYLTAGGWELVQSDDFDDIFVLSRQAWSANRICFSENASNPGCILDTHISDHHPVGATISFYDLPNPFSPAPSPTPFPVENCNYDNAPSH